jgi:outer membrane protein
MKGYFVMKKTQVLMLVFFITQTHAHGQSFSMNQCIDYALSNNSNIKISTYDQAIAQKKINEQLGSALPQVSASGSLDDNLKVATQLMPGEVMGRPGAFIPVQMGTTYNMSAGVRLEQKIYDPTFRVGLKAARISKDQSTLNLQKTKEQTAYSVCRVYYQTLIIQKQCHILASIRTATEQTLKATELKYGNGLVKKVDVDKIRVNYNNALFSLVQAELSNKQSLNNLKYQMGMPLDSGLVLADTSLNTELVKPESDAANGNYCEKRIDYQLLNINLKLQEADRSRNIAGYLPSLSFNVKYNYQSMPDNFTFGDNWYESSSMGLSLTIPVFDGFQKGARLAQSKYSIEKAKETIKSTERSIKVDVANYEMQYRNALENIENEKVNLVLAEDVYKNMQLSYQQGAGSSLELIQAESSLRESQNNYFNKLLSLYVARLDLEQSKGALMDFIGHNQ